MRAFIALEVPEEVKLKVEVLENDFRLDGLTLVKRNAMHITLHFLGELDQARIRAVSDVMKSVSFKPFRVVLSGVSYFTPRMIRVIFGEVREGKEEIKELYNKLGSAFKSNRISFEKEDYTPHLTFARVKWAKDMKKLRAAIEKNSKTALGSFEADSLVLKESVLTPKGPLYKTLYETEVPL